MARDRTDYFLGIVDATAKLATCNRGRSGAVIVKENHIIATGYVGSAPGSAHCDDVGHEFDVAYDEQGKRTTHCVRTTHAEMNALMQCAKFGVSTKGSVMYCTMFPCFTCAKAIVAAGIVQVCSRYDYQSSDRSKVLFAGRIAYQIMNPDEQAHYE